MLHWDNRYGMISLTVEQTQGAECPSVSYLRVTLVIIDHLLKTIIGCGKHFRNVRSFLCSPGS